jgi:hypothetical protein
MNDRTTLLLLVLGVCAVNGLYSPFLPIAIPITAVLMPELFPKTREWVLFFSSILVSTTTLFVSGVPAALWERLVARDEASLAGMWLWLAGAALMTLPALGVLTRS